jgi:hypothetical protein
VTVAAGLLASIATRQQQHRTHAARLDTEPRRSGWVANSRFRRLSERVALSARTGDSAPEEFRDPGLWLHDRRRVGSAGRNCPVCKSAWGPNADRRLMTGKLTTNLSAMH